MIRRQVSLDLVYRVSTKNAAPKVALINTRCTGEKEDLACRWLTSAILVIFDTSSGLKAIYLLRCQMSLKPRKARKAFSDGTKTAAESVMKECGKIVGSIFSQYIAN